MDDASQQWRDGAVYQAVSSQAVFHKDDIKPAVSRYTCACDTKTVTRGVGASQTLQGLIAEFTSKQN